ncbi:MAG: thiamine-phosphate kinase, partial [Flavobacterium sp.]
MLEDKTPQRTPISQIGEFALIDHLTKNFDVKQPSTLKSIGDDAAVLDFKNKKTVIS